MNHYHNSAAHQFYMKSVVNYTNKLLQSKPKKKYPNNLEETMQITHFSQIKQVTKPWGYELWVADAQNVPYALKIIFLKKGTRTSLQFHKEKSEHNFLFTGKIKLHYKDTKLNRVKTISLNAGHVIQIKPKAVHRIEALTNIILIEVSSPHIDDVIRLEDDYLRPDGKIEAEHNHN